MEQQILSVEVNGETIVSHVFDYEAMCLIDDARESGNLRQGEAAVCYLFEGTKVTDKVLKSLPVNMRTELSVRVMKWFNDAMNEALKNVYSPRANS